MLRRTLLGLAFFFGMQVPLWVLRATNGLRIESIAGEEKPDLEASQFGIRYLLGLMTGIAILLVFVKNSLPEGGNRSTFGPGTAETVIALLVLVTFSTATALPALGYALGERGRRAWLLWLIGMITLGPCVVMIIAILLWGSPPSIAVVTLMICSLAIGTAGTSMAVLLAARLQQFRLVTDLRDAQGP